MERNTISVLIFQHENVWSAQCLEYDIATQAKSLQDLYYEFERTLNGYFVVSSERGLPPFAKLGPAPQKYWEMFDNAKMKLKRDRLPFRVPLGVPLHKLEPHIRLAEAVA